MVVKLISPDQFVSHVLVGIHSCVACVGQSRHCRDYHSAGQTPMDALQLERLPWSQIVAVDSIGGNHPPSHAISSLQPGYATNSVLCVDLAFIQSTTHCSLLSELLSGVNFRTTTHGIACIVWCQRQ